MTFEYTCLECRDHRQFITEANALGAVRWQLIDVEQPHGFFVGFFMREIVDGDDACPLVHERIEGGALALGVPRASLAAPVDDQMIVV